MVSLLFFHYKAGSRTEHFFYWFLVLLIIILCCFVCFTLMGYCTKIKNQIKLTLVLYKKILDWESDAQSQNVCLTCCFLVLPDSLINISWIKYSLFISIPKVLCCCFKSYLWLPDLHLVSIMRQLECPVSGEQRCTAHLQTVFFFQKLC